MRAAVDIATGGSGIELLTLGHSNIELQLLRQLVKAHDVEVLVDVRSFPQSRFAPQFNRAVLERELPSHGIRYLFGGRELGGRPQDPSCYDQQGHVLYGRQATTPGFLAGIERLEIVTREAKTAIMCSEEDPTGCHRHLLIARVLHGLGWGVDHLRGDGTLQSYGSMADVLLRQHEQTDLFSQDENEDLAWRSIRSVSPNVAPPTSSEH
jgi:uncharacterized protein (DUF488 family)